MTVKTKDYIALYVVLLVSSFANVLSKWASGYPFLSAPFILLYGSALLIMGIYAIVWQQIIKKMPLTVAYANRAVLVVFGMLWGFILFGEPIKWNMMFGTVVIFVGIFLLVKCDEQ